MKVLKVKTKNGATSAQAIALKDFELIVGTSNIADGSDYSLYGLATDDPQMLNAFFTALLPFASEAGIADTIEELAEFWKYPYCVLRLSKSDFDILETEE